MDPITNTMSYFCDECGELLTDLKCTNLDYPEGSGEKCPLYGIPQKWQTMRAAKAISGGQEGVING